MNWKRYKVLVIGGAISLVLVVLSVLWLVKSKGLQSEQAQEIQSLQTQQSTLGRNKPFPSRSSFEQLERNKKILDEKMAAFQTNILTGQLNPPPMQRSLFGDYVKRDLVPSVRAAAAKAKKGGEQGVILRQPDLDLGTYVSGALPDQVQIPRLMIQLETMRHLAFLLFDQGISELVALEREAFEKATPGRPQPPVAGLGGTLAGGLRPGRGQATVQAETAPDPEAKIKELFDEETYTLKFRAYEANVWNVLNALSADSNQVVIDSVHITNGDNRLWPSYVKPYPGMTQRTSSRASAPVTRPSALESLLMGGDASPDEEEPAANSATLVGLRAKRELMTGGELLDVVLQLKVYRMKSGEPAGEKS